MTLETCKIQYEQAKERGDKEAMARWEARAKTHGQAIVEEKPKVEKKEKK